MAARAEVQSRDAENCPDCFGTGDETAMTTVRVGRPLLLHRACPTCAGAGKRPSATDRAVAAGP